MGGIEGTLSSTALTELNEDDLGILLNNTFYSRPLIMRWHESFLKDCPDGKLTKAKMLRSFTSLHGQKVDTSLVDRIFLTLDLDGSGYIDFVEFLVSLSITMKGRPVDKIRLAFDIFDIDKKGVVSKRELVRILQSIYSLIGEDLFTYTVDEKSKQILDKYEVAPRGMLTRDQFVEGCAADVEIRNLLSAPYRPFNGLS